MTDTVYLYNRRYTEKELKDVLKDSGFEVEELYNIQVNEYNFNFGDNQYSHFCDKKERIPNFVGVIYCKKTPDKVLKIVTLPKYLERKKMDKGREQIEELKLLRLFSKYKQEIVSVDPLFAYSCEHYSDVEIGEEILAYNKMYGAYTERKISYNKRRGRISWSKTVKKILPALIDNGEYQYPVYSDFIYQNEIDIENEITKIERGILQECGLIKELQDIDNIGEMYSADYLAQNMDYVLSIVERERASTFDDIKLERCRLIDQYLRAKLVGVYNKPKTFDKDYCDKHNIDNGKEIRCVLMNISDKQPYKIIAGRYYNIKCIVKLKLENCIELVSIYYNSMEEFPDGMIGKLCEIKVNINKEKGFYNFKSISEIEHSKDGKFAKAELSDKDNAVQSSELTYKFYAVARYDRVFEVLLSKYFSENTGIDFIKSIDGTTVDGTTACFKSEFGFNIPNMNDEKYRPYVFNLENSKENDANQFEDPYSNNKNLNFIDVAFDFYDNDHRKTCVILDAKDYGKSKNNKQNIVTSDSIFKQYFYEEIMANIYEDNKDKVGDKSDIRFVNAFVFPNLLELGPQDDLFSVKGCVYDKYRDKYIYIIRVNNDLLTDGCLEHSIGKAGYSKRRNDFIELIDSYMNEQAQKHS